MIKKIFIVAFTIVMLFSYKYPLFSEETKSMSLIQLQKVGFDLGNPSGDSILKLRNAILEIPDYESEKVSIEAFKNIDINGDKKKDLVVIISSGCSADPVEVFIVSSSNEDNYILQRLNTVGASLDKTLRDIDGDGKYEILLNEEIASDNTPACNAFIWLNICSWTEGQGFTMNNGKFLQSFYLKEYLCLISRRIADAEDRLKTPDKDPNAATENKIGLGMLEDCRMAISKLMELAGKK